MALLCCNATRLESSVKIFGRTGLTPLSVCGVDNAYDCLLLLS